jgi:CubicO group peptidase (beta-lactamase class C family)
VTATLPRHVDGRHPIPAAIEALVVDALAHGEAEGDLDDGVGPAVAVGLLWPDGESTTAVWGHLARWTPAGSSPGGRRRLSPAERRPADLQSRFDLASLTKPMATVTLWAHALAADAAQASAPAALLGTPLGAWLPDARGRRLGQATLGQVLGHASGVPAWRDFATAHPRDPAALRQAVLSTPADGPAGARAVYSDLGYMALGWALEHRGRAGLDELFAAQIARPLGLVAGFRPRAAACVATELWQRPGCSDRRLVSGVVHDDNAWALGGVAGHAGVFAPVGDVVRWARCWLDAARGLRGADRSLDPAVVRALLDQGTAEHTSWRLGWDTPSGAQSTAGERAGPRTFGHLGFTGTSVWLDPDRGAGLVLLTARVHPERAAVRGIRALRPRVADAAWSAYDAA